MVRSNLPAALALLQNVRCKCMKHWLRLLSGDFAYQVLRPMDGLPFDVSTWVRRTSTLRSPIVGDAVNRPRCSAYLMSIGYYGYLIFFGPGNTSTQEKVSMIRVLAVLD